MSRSEMDVIWRERKARRQLFSSCGSFQPRRRRSLSFSSSFFFSTPSLMTGTSKRPADSGESAGLATPVKRLKAEGGASNSESDKARPSGGVESSPAAGLDSTDSPLNGRSGRGGARGARGRGDSRGKGGRGSRGGDSRGKGGRGGGDRGGSDSRTWGGRSDNAKDGKKREWGGPKEGSPEADDKKERFPKKKVALLIGYNGLKYFGSQMYVPPSFCTTRGSGGPLTSSL